MKTPLLRKLCLLLMLFGVSDVFGQQKAPNLSLKDINGKTINLADLHGKVVLLNFWATWCTPCRTEIPDLIERQRAYRHRGLRIVGITYPPERISEVRRFTRKLQINYPVLIGSKKAKEEFTSSETLPLTVIIDQEGLIRGIIEGIMYSDEFEENVKPLLQSRPDRASGNGTDTKLPTVMIRGAIQRKLFRN